MANIVLDFLHNYQTGERRESEPANAYQYDEGHVLEAVLPEVITSCEIHYWIRGMEEADAYTPTSITPNSDGSCTVLGNIPNSYFETNGELRIYIVVTDGTASITTYEGKLHIAQRAMPDDYVDDDPENEAVQIIAAARGYAETSEAWAVGQINGEDVPSTADQYQNNAAYYANQAAAAASSAEEAAETFSVDLALNATSTHPVQNQVVAQAINTVNNAIGDPNGETITPTATNNYGIGGSVGQVIETWATTDYWHGIYAVTAGNRYAIQTVSDYPQQIVVWFTNSSNVILEIHKAFATDHVEMVCTAPTGATKLFVMSYGYDAYHGTVQKVEPLSETVSNLKESINKTFQEYNITTPASIPFQITTGEKYVIQNHTNTDAVFRTRSEQYGANIQSLTVPSNGIAVFIADNDTNYINAYSSGEYNMSVIPFDTVYAKSLIALHAISRRVLNNWTTDVALVPNNYIVVNGMFCKVTATIAAGGTIIINTNAVMTTVASELTTIMGRINI